MTENLILFEKSEDCPRCHEHSSLWLYDGQICKSCGYGDTAIDFEVGELVFKTGSGYSGPGKVFSRFSGVDGHVRFVVGHAMTGEGATGAFYHIYGSAQLRKIKTKE